MAAQDSTTAKRKQQDKKTLRFNKDALNALPAPATRVYLYDDKVPQLGLIHHPATKTHPEGKKVFFARVTFDGRTERWRIENGVFPGMPIDLARERAREHVTAAAQGTHPIKAKRAKKAAKAVSGLTVEQALDLFAENKVRRLSTGEKLPLKPRTIAAYRHSIRKLLGDDLYAGPLNQITEAVLTKRVQTREKVAKTATAGALRSLSAVWNWLGRQREYREQLPDNPVREYSRYNEGLHVPAPKKGRIEKDELPAWFDAVEALPAMYAEYYQWLLFTGTRTGEARGLDWQDIDFKRNVYHLRDPKNRRPASLPLPSVIGAKLKNRKQDAGKVFTFADDPKRQRKKVVDALGKHWTNHDLRRTFAGVAQAVCSYTSVKRLLNHTFTDITEQYIGEAADLGEEIAKVERELLRLAGRPLNNVVALREVKA
ncbi:MAG: integrase family protein [Gammaproteobacteria bacterium]|nr:integrase family protein [Gammaproteobacteria bacterium]